VLKVAHRYKFSAIRTLAISHLYLLTTPVEKIVLARKYAITSWLSDAFLEVCRREQLPNEEEVARLKYDTHHEIRRVLAMLLRCIAMQLQPSRCIAVLR
jgi:hypothetical protein